MIQVDNEIGMLPVARDLATRYHRPGNPVFIPEANRVDRPLGSVPKQRTTGGKPTLLEV